MINVLLMNVLCYCSFAECSFLYLCPVPYQTDCKSQKYNFVPYIPKLVVYFRFKRFLCGKGRILHLCPKSVLKVLIFAQNVIFDLLTRFFIKILKVDKRHPVYVIIKHF